MDWNLKASSWDLGEVDEANMGNIETMDGGSSRDGEIHRSSGEFCVDLKLGQKGNCGMNESVLTKSRLDEGGVSKVTASKSARAINSGTQIVSCLVDGCQYDLSKCREYHRRHKVCEIHSKIAEVIIGGQKRRFCQQCSRFHSLEEFDEGKRTCRKRLDGHNKRRKSQTAALTRCGSFMSNYPHHHPQVNRKLHENEGTWKITDPAYVGQWHRLVRIELMDNKISELPQSPHFPKLEVLLLQGNVDLMDIPHSFFYHMPLLQHLDLSKTSIRDLPPSISKLKQLKKLYLRSCELFLELPQNIKLLKKLEELDLDETLITNLPQEVRELINLQRLILCFDQELGYDKEGNQISTSTIIPRGVISSLTQLNHLSINVDPEDERWNNNVINILVEILELERLETVNIYIPKAEILELVPAHKSIKFKLVVGHKKNRCIRRVTPEAEKKFQSCESSIQLVNGANVPKGVNMNLKLFNALYLDRHMTIKSISELDLKNLFMLQMCILAECNEMKTIFDGSYTHAGHALPLFESLFVFYMKNLRSICEGPKYSLFYLKSIALHTCPMLTTIFTTNSLNCFPLLEELTVEDCPKVTTLISHDDDSLLECVTNSVLQKLRTLLLLYLPELVSIFNGLRVGEGIRVMGFYYCPKLGSISKLELPSESLRVIKGERKWWEALEWKVGEWGDGGRPNFLNLIFSPTKDNGEVDIMTQLVACCDEIKRDEEDERERKRKSLVTLDGRRPPALRHIHRRQRR